jgi:hypothetical protein
MPKFIVIAGNPVEGLLYFGPYDSFDEACKDNDTPGDHEWWVAELIDPADMSEHALPSIKLR